ncbi:MAG: hypothetical protein K1X28_06275 [Parachlamydiales bacterium]|nr:hypothetical protein [Parachlamydiales bacterium]
MKEKPNCKTIAIIVGTGLWKSLSALNLSEREIFQDKRVSLGHRMVDILYYEIGYFKDLRVVILPRHGTLPGKPQRSPAELIFSHAHEAHIWFLATMGVEEIYGFNTVGALDPSLPLANTDTFVIPNDLGYGLGVPVHSFGSKAKYPHPEMNSVFSEELRSNLKKAVVCANAKAIQTGTYIYSNIDHLETAAEGRALRRLYEHAAHPVVGSTAGAELVLAREMGLKYALLCSVSNYVQGVTERKVGHEEIIKIMDEAGRTLVRIIENICEISQAQKLEEVCPC